MSYVRGLRFFVRTSLPLLLAGRGTRNISHQEFVRQSTYNRRKVTACFERVIRSRMWRVPSVIGLNDNATWPRGALL